MSKEERNIEFWYGFHPHDRDVLWPRLLASYPFSHTTFPFTMKTFTIARGECSTYEERPSFWPREQEFEPRSISRKYSPSLMSDPRLGPIPSFSRLFSESLSKPAPLAPEDKLSPSPSPRLRSFHLHLSCLLRPLSTEPESSIVPTSPSMSSLAPRARTLSLDPSPSPCLRSFCQLCLPCPLCSHSSPCARMSSLSPSPYKHASLYLFSSTSSKLSLPLLPSSCHVNVPKPECTPPTLPMSCISFVLTPLSEPELMPSLIATPFLPSILRPWCLSAPVSPVRFSLGSSEEPEPECERSVSPSSNPAAPLSSPFDSPPVPPVVLRVPFPPVSLAQTLILSDLESQFESSLSPVDDVSLSASDTSLESCEASSPSHLHLPKSRAMPFLFDARFDFAGANTWSHAERSHASHVNAADSSKRPSRTPIITFRLLTCLLPPIFNH